MNYSGISSHHPVGRLLRFPLKFIPNGARMRVLQGPLRGKQWIAGSSTHGCWLGSYEYNKQRVFAKAVKAGDIVWDLGANVGFYSLLASTLVGPIGRVFSFEPVLRNAALLRRHLELNSITNCSVLELAVGDSNGIATFDVGPNPSMGCLAGRIEPEESRSTCIRVRTARLDDLVASGEILPPRIIKCDIEGAEAAALEGSMTTLTRHRPIIFLATHGRKAHRASCDILRRLKYELVPLERQSIEFAAELMARPDPA